MLLPVIARSLTVAALILHALVTGIPTRDSRTQARANRTALCGSTVFDPEAQTRRELAEVYRNG